MNCPNCNQPTGSPDWKAKEHILWANAHGRKIRIFCKKCGQWTDVRLTNWNEVKDTYVVQKSYEKRLENLEAEMNEMEEIYGNYFPEPSEQLDRWNVLMDQYNSICNEKDSQ